MRVPLAFPELNVSSPSPVFTSPRINQMRKENSLRRLQYLSSDSGKLSLEYTAGTKELLENGSHHGLDASHSRGVLIPKHEFPAHVQSCSSPSGCVDDFFVDPMEHCVNSLAPSELCLDEAVESCQPSRDRCGSPGKTPSKECIQLQRYHLSCSVNELVANKAENGKTANSIEMFPDHCRSHAVEIHDSGTKEIITTIHSHEGNIKEGGIKVAEPSTPACQAEESPMAYEGPTHLICGQTKDSVDVADNIHKNGERQFNQCTGLPSRHAMKDDPAEVLASVNLESCRHSADLTANGTVSIQPSGAKGDSLDHVAETHLAEDGRGAEQDATSQFQLELLHIVHPYIHHQDNSRAGCNTSIQHAISCKQGHLPSKLQLELFRLLKVSIERPRMKDAKTIHVMVQMQWKTGVKCQLVINACLFPL